MLEAIKVRFKHRTCEEDEVRGLATSAPGNDLNRAGGYIVVWEDGVQDHPDTRWYFDNDDWFDIEEITE